MSIQFRSRIKSVVDYSKVLNGIGVCCDKDGNKTLKSFYDCFNDGGNYFPGESLSAVNFFGNFLRDLLLKYVESNIVIFIDEIDSTISLQFNVDDFFALIRSFYNRRVDNVEYDRLSFVL